MKDITEENEEKPKAVIEMEENSDVGKAKKRIRERKEQDIKTANKIFFIKYFIFLIMIVSITGGAIYYSIKQLNKEESNPLISEEISSKPLAADSKYAINSYAETYDENSLKIKYYAGNDQLVENTYGRARICPNRRIIRQRYTKQYKQ